MSRSTKVAARQNAGDRPGTLSESQIYERLLAQALDDPPEDCAEWAQGRAHSSFADLLAGPDTRERVERLALQAAQHAAYQTWATDWPVRSGRIYRHGILVAHWSEFPDLTTVVRWLGLRPSVAVYESPEDMRAVHGHPGTTFVET